MTCLLHWKNKGLEDSSCSVKRSRLNFYVTWKKRKKRSNNYSKIEYSDLIIMKHLVKTKSGFADCDKVCMVYGVCVEIWDSTLSRGIVMFGTHSKGISAGKRVLSMLLALMLARPRKYYCTAHLCFLLGYFKHGSIFLPWWKLSWLLLS